MDILLRRVAAGTLLLGTLALGACSDEVLPTNTTEPQVVVVGGTDYDLNSPLSGSLVVNGATWTWPVPFNVGTGQISPFLSVQANDIEQGFNSLVESLDGKRYTNFTHGLALNHVPVIAVGGVLYREIILDANEANSGIDARFAIRKFDLWMCSDAAAPNYDAVSDFTGNSNCELVYDLAGRIGRATDEVTSGSGLDLDYQILIPDAFFETSGGDLGADLAPCQYQGPDAPSCGIYLVLHTIMGAPAPFSPAADSAWVTGSTFEEFSTIDRPWITVSKTAVPAFTREHLWKIEKSVSPDSWQFLPGQNGTSNYAVTVTDTGYIDYGHTVSGVITISNPSDGATSVTAIRDTIKTEGQPPIGVTVTGCALPIALAAGATVNCNYSAALPNGMTRYNEVTVVMAGAGVNTATTVIDFSAVTPTVVNGTITVTDKFEDEALADTLGTTSSTHTYNFSRQYDCGDDGGFGGDGDFDNRASIVQTGQFDDEDVTVACGNLVVTKVASTSLRRRYHWTIDKSVTPATWALFNGDSATSAYSVVVTKTGAYTDSAWAVHGWIDVTNVSTFPVTLSSLADTVSGVGAATLDCGAPFPYTLGAGQSMTCNYARGLPNGNGRTNKATARVGALSFTGVADVSFATPIITPVHESVHVDDTYAGGPQDQLVSGTTGFNYSRTFGCPAGNTYNNTATITETGQSDNASVTVTCHYLTVTKTANTRFMRTWDWDITKTLDPSHFLPGTYVNDTARVQESEVLQVYWDLVVDTVAHADSDWQVWGNILVKNHHPSRPATLNSLADVVSPAIAATVSDCEVGGDEPAGPFPMTLAVGDSLTCYYEANVPDGTTRTDTVKAVQQNYRYNPALVATPIGTWTYRTTATATFGAIPTYETDECITGEDILSKLGAQVVPPTDFGPWCVSGGLPHTFEIMHTFGGPDGIPLECENNHFDNVGAITANDTGATDSDPATIDIYVECAEGCTLTLGYWKTHNESFKARVDGHGPPADTTWQLLPGGLAESTMFYLSGQTWFQVFMTAPQGNVYYALAHQYMAAKLNVLAGADPAALGTALTDAEALFATYTPAQIGALKGKPSDAVLRNRFITLAGILGDFNEGDIGPGHCTENGS